MALTGRLLRMSRGHQAGKMLRLDVFPRITNKDVHRLRDLGDLLLELQSMKESDRLPGLAYLDTVQEVNPIVKKFLFNLRDKWIT